MELKQTEKPTVNRTYQHLSHSVGVQDVIKALQLGNHHHLNLKYMFTLVYNYLKYVTIITENKLHTLC